ncbi:MAG: hypothetical protein ACYC6Y_25735 [Thermoguttaceae bacterium]
MSPYPDNIRSFVTQESVKLGESGYDVEVEIVRRADLVVTLRDGREVVSVGLKEYCPLPDMGPDDLFVVFDLGTVLEMDDMRIVDSESALPLAIESLGEGNRLGPVRVPLVLKGAAQISLLLSARHRPLGTLTVDIEREGRLADSAFLPDHEEM